MSVSLATTTPKLMFIEDDKVYVFVFKKLLEQLRQPVNFLHYFDAISALNSLKTADEDELPDIIFLDINLPAINGFSFLELLVETEVLAKKKIYIYMLTSSIKDSDVEAAGRYKCVSGFFMKPINVENIEHTIRSL